MKWGGVSQGGIMNNVHPVFADALAPFAPAPVRVSKPLRPFSVKVMEGGEPVKITVLAENSCDAVSQAFEIFSDGKSGMTVFVRPLS
jgi:hypothetical protein